ncbi:MAG: L-fucose mutarotase [Bacillota bacterium]|jgi:L-fucose mutarotase|nr:L-fucose mutarotase [Bacillota bacterium]NLJ03450.1 L-fucose mutarotase [Bacillota bacterium]
MLMKIPPIISPELIKTLMEMGHGDELVLGDGNFPAASLAKRLVRCDGHNVPDLLDAILQLFPLDAYVEHPVMLMDTGPGEARPEIWARYEEIVAKNGGTAEQVTYLERFEFYERAKQAYAVVATGETAIYANIILKKGVVTV